MAVEVGQFSIVHDGAVVGKNTRIGSHCVIYPGTVIGDDCVIADHSVIGKRASFSPISMMNYGDKSGGARLEDGVKVGAHTTIYAGALIESGAFIADYAWVRERTIIGEKTIIGTNARISTDVQIGKRCRIQMMAQIVGVSVIEDQVFVGNGVVVTNNRKIHRVKKGETLHGNGVILRRGCRIGGGVVFSSGVEVGEEALVGAGSVVTKNVAPRVVVVGNPARFLRHVSDTEFLTEETL